jgi:excisionase family DNA binding protein
MGIDMSTRRTTSTSHQPLLTAREIAVQLRVSIGQVYRLARTKRIPAYHLGNAVRFNLSEILVATITTPPPVHVPKTAAQRLAIVRLQNLARRRPVRSSKASEMAAIGKQV